MIIHNVEQGSPEWRKVKLGIPSASNFSRIITPGGKKSASADKYIAELLSEIMTGKCEVTFKSDDMMRGNELEPRAAELYSFKYDVELMPGGFVTDDNRMAGCSPDRLIGDIGGLEIKCPIAKNHVEYMLCTKIDDDYKPQVQGTLALLDLEWWDVMSYHTELMPVIIRTVRDEKYIADFKTYLSEFNEKMAESMQFLREKGYYNG